MLVVVIVVVLTTVVNGARLEVTVTCNRTALAVYDKRYRLGGLV